MTDRGLAAAVARAFEVPENLIGGSSYLLRPAYNAAAAWFWDHQGSAPETPEELGELVEAICRAHEESLEAQAKATEAVLTYASTEKLASMSWREPSDPGPEPLNPKDL